MPTTPPPDELHPPRLADIRPETPVEARYPRTSRRKAAQKTWLIRFLIVFVAVHALFGAKEILYDRVLGGDRRRVAAQVELAAAPAPVETVTEVATERVTEWVPPDPVVLRRRPTPPELNAPQPSEPPAPPMVEPRTVTVQRGDTLSGLAQRHLGSAARWGEIATLNGVMDPRLLQPGATLRLPDR